MREPKALFVGDPAFERVGDFTPDKLFPWERSVRVRCGQGGHSWIGSAKHPGRQGRVASVSSGSPSLRLTHDVNGPEQLIQTRVMEASVGWMRALMSSELSVEGGKEGRTGIASDLLGQARRVGSDASQSRALDKRESASRYGCCLLGSGVFQAKSMIGRASQPSERKRRSGGGVRPLCQTRRSVNFADRSKHEDVLY